MGEGGQVASEAGASGSRSICCSRLGRHEARARASRDAALGQSSSPVLSHAMQSKRVMPCLCIQIHYPPHKLQNSNAGMQVLIECLSCGEHVAVLLTRH